MRPRSKLDELPGPASVFIGNEPNEPCGKSRPDNGTNYRHLFTRRYQKKGFFQHNYCVSRFLISSFFIAVLYKMPICIQIREKTRQSRIKENVSCSDSSRLKSSHETSA